MRRIKNFWVRMLGEEKQALPGPGIEVKTEEAIELKEKRDCENCGWGVRWGWKFKKAIPFTPNGLFPRDADIVLIGQCSWQGRFLGPFDVTVETPKFESYHQPRADCPGWEPRPEGEFYQQWAEQPEFCVTRLLEILNDTR